MVPLVIIGAGGFGREVSWLVEEINKNTTKPKWHLLGFLDDDVHALDRFTQYGAILGPVDSYRDLQDPFAVCAVGDPRSRKAIVERLETLGARWATLIHPTASIGTASNVGEGCILCKSAVVTVDAKIGNHVQFNVHASAGHDAEIGDLCTLSAFVDVCGGALLEEGTFLGSHASVLPKASVGAWARVGAGSVVLRHVRSGKTVLGVPGKEI